jgi:peptidoglycan hydrolase CwlO-like protein
LAKLEASQARMAGELQRYKKLKESYEAKLNDLKEKAEQGKIPIRLRP